MNLSDCKEQIKEVIPVETKTTKIFFARKHFWNKWQGFVVTSIEEYKDWHEKHKGWKKCTVFIEGEVYFPDVVIERWTLQSSKDGA